MTSSTTMIYPSPTMGKNRRIDNVFVYPSEIKVNQLQEGLSRTLSLWPLVSGRILLENDQNYYIEMCDNPVPITFAVNDHLRKWPLASIVVLDEKNEIFPTFLDLVQIN